MDILPAIDLRSGKCVRLIQGQYHRQITYEDDPVKQACLFESDGVTEIIGSSDTRIADGERGIAEKTIAQTGTYYLKVWQYGTAVTEGSYDLAVYNAWYNPGATDEAREYFQTFRTARYIANGTYLANDLGVHVYRFRGQAGTPVQISVTKIDGVGGLKTAFGPDHGFEEAALPQIPSQ